MVRPMGIRERRATGMTPPPHPPVWQVSSSCSTSVAIVIIILNPEIAASSSSHQDVPTTTRLPSCPRHQNGVIQVSSPSSYLSEWCRRRRHICHQNKKFRSRELTWCRLQQASMGCQTEDLGARPPPKYIKVIISGIHCHHRRYNFHRHSLHNLAHVSGRVRRRRRRSTSRWRRSGRRRRPRRWPSSPGPSSSAGSPSSSWL